MVNSRLLQLHVPATLSTQPWHLRKLNNKLNRGKITLPSIILELEIHPATYNPIIEFNK